MAKSKPAPTNPWSAAQKHLSKSDPTLAAIIKRVGPCGLKPRRDHFAALVESILSQQISVHAAAAIYGRFRLLFPAKRITPQHLLTLSDEDIRASGVGPQKMRYLKDIASGFVSGRFPAHKLNKLTDEELIQALCTLKGVGRWTAEMYLMFVLCRPDVLPVDDVGLLISAHNNYNLRTRPDAKKLLKMGEPWRPYRTIASWYLWKAKEGDKEPADQPLTGK